MSRILDLLLALTFAGCTTATHNSRSTGFSPNYSADLPTVLDFSIKNGKGDTLIVHYFFGDLFVTEQLGSQTYANHFAPTPKDWSMLWASLDSIQIWDWGNGVDSDDPNFWSFHLSHGNREISIDGTHFERGLNGDLSPKKEG